MSSIRIPKPGTEYGPCIKKCVHTDCRASRIEATRLCLICGKEIGYDVDYYNDGPDAVKHAACAFVESRKYVGCTCGCDACNAPIWATPANKRHCGGPNCARENEKGR